MSGFRLPEPHGTRIDRSRPIPFLFNGKVLTGFRGDTLASALLANGVRLVGRSYKLHRARGVFGCGVEEPNAIVDLVDGDRRTPDVRATTQELTEGLAAESVNCWPSVGIDLGAIVGAFAPFLPAGFYYKTFMWPDWHWFEPAIRWMAGLGRTSLALDRDRYEEVSIDADVAVVGGGIAGLSAAVAAAEAGAATTLLCAAPAAGGALGWR
ncbi:MAG: (2Fe-2S)-binding protein, partial [Gammaproteobacteria bacterium]|nr:(2Fe-2S)-binding protein [Gammaproteobacteria bacterium]